MKIEKHTLTEKDIGRTVVYFERGGKKVCRGRIKSWNDTFVFVVFCCDDDWDNYQNYTGQACCSEDLKWADYVILTMGIKPKPKGVKKEDSKCHARNRS